jgi:3-hydroxybutyrate dehydrogenase
MSIVACVYQREGKGANKLKELFKDSNRFHLVELDITKNSSINDAKKYVEELLDKNTQLQLTALVNNAGVMVFGESEWQTDEMIEHQVNVNLIGTIKMTTAFLPLIRKHKARIVNVSSHCAIQSLPTLSVYGATKSGIASYTESLRMEMKKYDVDVVNFIPGSFFGNSNLVSSQLKHASTMKQSLNKEQLEFYEDYLDRLNMHLAAISVEREPQLLQDQRIIEKFEDALLQLNPNPVYKSEPMRYKFYHFLFNYMPFLLHDWLVDRFVLLPKFTPK